MACLAVRHFSPAASSTAIATCGLLANATATAQAGAGVVQGGAANATATGNGASGTATANALTSSAVTDPANAILSAQAQASATVATTAISDAALQYGNTAMAFITNRQAVANATLAPATNATAVTNVLGANAAIATAFTGATQYYAVGELGGAHSTGGTAVQTQTSSFSLKLAQSAVPAGGDLIVGLYGGETTGSGVTGVSLSVTENGATVAALSFTNDTAAQAKAAFADMAQNLGALSGTGTIALDFSLSVTSDAANSGFFGGLFIGDPPAAHPSNLFHPQLWG